MKHPGRLFSPYRITAAALSLLCAAALAQPGTAPVKRPKAVTEVDRISVGDAPEDPGPLATDVSPELTRKAVRAAMVKVADWQLRTAQGKFNAQWTFAALYDGLLAASATTGNARYRDAVEHFAEQQQWQLIDGRFPHADDMALGQAYLDLYRTEPPAQRSAVQIAPTKAVLDRLVARPDDAPPARELWWWCDSLFMAPPVLARMAAITGDSRYDAFMEREWDITTRHLWDPFEHLYFRDADYLNKKQANGRNFFWSRGNGWVMGALVKILEVLPANDPGRPRFVEQLREMADAVKTIQSPDGLWRSGLLDPDAYDAPELSGSAFFTYAIAYGINEHLLDRQRYEPVVARAWRGMIAHIYADGRLGSIQSIDKQPGKIKASGSYVYGVGGFLLAASEVDRMVGRPDASKHSPHRSSPAN